MTEQPSSILSDLTALATRFAGRKALAEDRIFADLDINGGDFIEFVEEVEHRYEVDLSWISPLHEGAEARDPTLMTLAAAVQRQRG